MILPLLLLGLALPAALASFTGKWTDAGDGGYGGEFFVCEDAASGIAQGFYSETGYARGAVVEAGGVRTWSGFWYEPGDDDNLENWGGFALQLSDDGQSFNGTWTYASRPAEVHVWGDERLGDEQPALRECMAVNSEGVLAQLTYEARPGTQFGLQGSWLGNGTYSWHICYGEGGKFVSSYKYDSDGTPLRGYIRGEAQLDGQLMMGDYWEEGNDHGLFMIALLNNREMMYTYWAVESLLDVDIAQKDDSFIHLVDFTRRVSTETTFTDCNRYSALASGGTVNDDDDDDDDDPYDDLGASATVIALSVLLAVFTTATVAGGGYYVYGNHERRRKQARRNSRSN